MLILCKYLLPGTGYRTFFEARSHFLQDEDRNLWPVYHFLLLLGVQAAIELGVRLCEFGSKPLPLYVCVGVPPMILETMNVTLMQVVPALCLCVCGATVRCVLAQEWFALVFEIFIERIDSSGSYTSERLSHLLHLKSGIPWPLLNTYCLAPGNVHSSG